MSDAPTGRRRRRWGLYTLLCLLWGTIAALTAQAMGYYTLGTLGSMVVSVILACFCTVRGIQDLSRRGILPRK
jgi:tetrahydromethanopterin S-methyltransferase subunit C